MAGHLPVVQVAREPTIHHCRVQTVGTSFCKIYLVMREIGITYFCRSKVRGHSFVFKK
jgi:hypothetical protein